jgi:four helix bundle protein
MGGVLTFKDLLVWQKSHHLVLYVYSITKNFPKHELFGQTSQTRRSVVSVAANIVEGFRRQGLRDSINFYNISDASLEELKYHILLARDLNYIDEASNELFIKKAEETGKLLTGWIKSQKNFL